jgi:hypothetical protein
MAEIVNLNRARKARLREEAKLGAAVNRAAFGRTKPERLKAERERERTEREIAGKELD